MYSRCPHCDKQHEITVEHLRQRRGLLNCSACGKSFDTLRFLSEQEDAVLADDLHYQDKQISDRRPQTPAVWLVATSLMSVLLLAQVLYFEGYRLTMQPQIRVGLDKICSAIACRLPPYRNREEWSVSHSNLQVQTDGSYLFSAAVSNQALFTQIVPDLKLTLLNFNGQAIAGRMFSASEYLPKLTSLATEQTVEIRLAVVAPTAPIGGYTFNLL